MQAIVEVALQGPGELRMLDVARMQRRVVGVQAQAAILQLDHQLDGAVVLARREIHQRVLVAAQLGFDLLQDRRGSRIYASVKKHGMSLPATVRVKLSSEAAEGISITRVVVQDLPVRDLVEHMLGITGKNEARVRELLLRGTLVSGASRFRWTGWDADLDGLRELLATFPGDDPARPFAAGAVRARGAARRTPDHRDPARGRRAQAAAAQDELLGCADGAGRGG